MSEELRQQLEAASTPNSPAVMRDKIVKLEAVMMAMKHAHIEIATTHYFAPGVYMRQVFIPKGAIVTGKIHKTEHLNILSQGELTVYTEDGMKRLKASTVIKSQPGIKRAAVAHEDSVWITVHHNPDDERDPDKIEERLIAKTFSEVQGFKDETRLIKEDK